MDKRFQLQPLLELSNLRLDEATRQLGKLIASEQEASQRLSLLIEYRTEYHSRFLDAANKGLDPAIWRNYQHFLDRIDEAIEQARAMLATSKQRTAAGQKHWLDQRSKVKAFDTLAQRHRQRIAHAESRSEQKLSDEHAARRHGAAKAEE